MPLNSYLQIHSLKCLPSVPSAPITPDKTDSLLQFQIMFSTSILKFCSCSAFSILLTRISSLPLGTERCGNLGTSLHSSPVFSHCSRIKRLSHQKWVKLFPSFPAQTQHQLCNKLTFGETGVFTTYMALLRLLLIS